MQFVRLLKSMENLKEINRKTKEAYDKAAQKYYYLFYNELDNKPFDIKIINSYLSYLGLQSIIGDMGCGPCGHIEDYVSKKGYNIIGIDISEKCVEIAQENFPEIKFQVGDMSSLNYKDNYFDGLISYYSIIGTPRKYVTQVLDEYCRVLKKNGILLLVLKEGIEEGYQKELLGIETEIYMSLFTEEETKKYLEASNFEIIKIEKRKPYKDEIKIDRIFSISKKK